MLLRPNLLERVMYYSGKEEETAGPGDSGSVDLPSLPDFFSHKHFLLYGELNSTTRRSVIRYITAYNG